MQQFHYKLLQMKNVILLFNFIDYNTILPFNFTTTLFIECNVTSPLWLVSGFIVTHTHKHIA